jgi:hypothetical protein
MDAELAFRLLNLSVMPWWGTWIVAPRSQAAQMLASHAGIFVALSAVYLAGFASVLATDGLSGGLDFEGLRAGLSTPGGFLTGWTHYLIFDLFIGAWILRESARIAVEPRVFLFLTLMVGPIGLGSFLLRRALRLGRFGGLGD